MTTSLTDGAKNSRYEVFDLPGDPKVVVGLYRYGEVYVLCFDNQDDIGRLEAMRTLGRWAVNPNLSFTWFDAAKVFSRLRSVLARIRSSHRP